MQPDSPMPQSSVPVESSAPAGAIGDETDLIRNTWLTLIRCHDKPTFAAATKIRCHHCNWTVGNDCDYCHGLGHAWILSPGGWRIYPIWSAPLENFFEFRPVVEAHDLSTIRDSFSSLWGKGHKIADEAATEVRSSAVADILANLIPTVTIKRRF